MIRADLTRKLTEAIDRLNSSARLLLPDEPIPIEISEPRGTHHGDFSTNFALIAAKKAKRAPHEVAALLAGELSADEDIFAAEVAGPGFINLTLHDYYLARWAGKADEVGENLHKLEAKQPQNILVEFVSVNPNGPIHLGHGRGAAFGDTLARVLEAAGHEVTREFYVNDGVNSLQMRLFARSVKALYRKSLGLEYDFPDEGYKGEYVQEVADRIRAENGDGHADGGLDFFQPVSQNMMIEQQKADLERFGVVFDNWFSEQSLHDGSEVAVAIDVLKEQGHAYEQDGALWLKSTDFGDDKDRCIIRSNGEPTYIASDIAYHKDKFDRGHDLLINVWGPDHHGYVARTSAAIQALGYQKERIEMIITQIVRFVKDGKPAPMRKRDGELFRLADLMDELGPDVTRFFFLMRSHDTHMDFDLDLAREHSEKNPMFYAQYAHARICSLLTKAEEQGFRPDAGHVARLTHEAERNLIKKIWDLPYEVGRVANDHGIHRLTLYAVELAREYHDFYDKCRVILPEDPDLAAARLVLCSATRNALRGVFHLIGISAPESM